MMNNVTITKHAFDRMKERNGWSKKTAIRMVDKIYESGKRSEDVTGYTKTWLKRKKKDNSDNSELIVYGQKVYLFINNAMITVFQVPSRQTCIGNL